MSDPYFNFINTLNSERTKVLYAYCLNEFLTFTRKNLVEFISINNADQTNLIIQYLVSKKVSAQYKNVILATIKHACDMNDVILNWRKIKKFTGSTKTGNEIAGKDRGYTHAEIAKILEFSDQRIKTAFLILCSTGIRYGALPSLKVGDLERIDDLFKVTVYSGEKEQYTTFTTIETAKAIDAYLDFRRRTGEHITSDSYVIVQRNGQPFKGYSLRSILQDSIGKTGLKEIGPKFKRKETPLLHAFRKFFTKQLMDSKVDKAIVELLHGHDIGLTGRYWKPTQQELYQEYLKAVPALTISQEEKLKVELNEKTQIQKTVIESLQQQMDLFKREVNGMKKRKRK